MRTGSRCATSFAVCARLMPSGETGILGGHLQGSLFVCEFKPSQDNMGETVDVLVTSGNYGTGRRGGGVSTLVCSVRDISEASDAVNSTKWAHSRWTKTSLIRLKGIELLSESDRDFHSRTTWTSGRGHGNRLIRIDRPSGYFRQVKGQKIKETSTLSQKSEFRIWTLTRPLVKQSK